MEGSTPEMTPCTGRLRLHQPILPTAKVGGGLRISDRCSTAGGMTYTRQKHALTLASAEKSPKDLRLDEDNGSLHSRQRKEWNGEEFGDVSVDLIRYPDDKCLLVDALLDTVKWDDKGFAVAIVQKVDTGAILMQGFANRDALATTISSCKATFYSRLRSKLWTKGETSSYFINIIYLGKHDGPTCHTGSETCYFSSVSRELEPSDQVEESELATSTLSSLESTISKRKAELGQPGSGKPSWMKKLLLSRDLLCRKMREEADKLCRTLEDNEDKSLTALEMAGVLYHSMVLLAVQDVKMEDVLEILRQSFSQSGIEEKQSWARN